MTKHPKMAMEGRRDYCHPYEPYEVQKDFMDALYRVLCSKKVGIFESPTGTGKTLSLICPSVTWLREREERTLLYDIKDIEKGKGPQWIKENAKTLRYNQHKLKGKTTKQIIADAQAAAKEQEVKKTEKFKPHAKKFKPNEPSYVIEDTVEESFLDNTSLEELEGLETPSKIFFASRTHSQLSQLSDALKKLNIPVSWSDDTAPVRYVPLGSRRQLCINPQVAKLQNVQAINDRCAELGKRCEFRSDDSRIAAVRNMALADIEDIGELAASGRKLGGCSFYGSRAALAYAEVVSLPYQLLIQSETRRALGINLEDSVVIIDEAHNLMDTISSSYSEKCSCADAQQALKGLKAYAKRVGARLSSNNRTKVFQTTKLIESLLIFFEKNSSDELTIGKEVQRQDLFAYGNVDTLNIQELSNFIHESKLVFKVDSYLKSEEPQASLSGQVLGKVLQFLQAATDPLAEGKLFWDKSDKKGEWSLSYLLLDTENSFRDIVDEARCVILAGGTMEPIKEFLNNLFPYLNRDEIEIFTCGHIIPRENLLVQPVTDKNLQLTFSERSRPGTLDTLSHYLLKIAEVVPAGLVLFFPGYDYLNKVVAYLRNSGKYNQLLKCKKVFVENPQETTILEKFTKEARNGACLFAVVGGRLSEGINFSDDLARGVVMVGLPFPNAFSAELAAKRQHVETKALKRGLSISQAREAAREYYESLAMRAVNQSVGRAIRHAQDYAAIYLLDSRYANERVKSKLSRWVRDCLPQEEKGEGEETTLLNRSLAFFAKTRD